MPGLATRCPVTAPCLSFPIRKRKADDNSLFIFLKDRMACPGHGAHGAEPGTEEGTNLPARKWGRNLGFAVRVPRAGLQAGGAGSPDRGSPRFAGVMDENQG